MGGSDLWSNTLPLDNGGAPAPTQEGNVLLGIQLINSFIELVLPPKL